MDEVFDVVLVGYGPVGQVLAAGLGQQGHRVQVLERHLQRYTVSRAGTLDHEMMRILQSVGVTGELEPKLSRLVNMSFMDAEGRLMTRVGLVREGVSGWHDGYTMYQPDLEDALHRAVRAQPSVEVLTGWEVQRIVQEADHVVVESRHRGSGEPRTSRGRYVVGADGANSVVRDGAGFAQDDLGYRGPWLVVDVEHHDPAVELRFRDGFILDPQRPALVGRWLGRTHSRMEFMLVAGETPEDFAEERCWELAARWGITPATSIMVRHAVYEFGSWLARDWRAGRVLLAGDAAHVMPPFLGQGLRSGVRDAANLLWKLDLVLRGQAADRLLDTYTEERRPHVEQAIRMSMRMGAMISITDPQQAAARDAALRDQGPPPAPPLPGLAAGVLHGGGGSPTGAGSLSRQARVEINGKRGRLDDLVGNGWRILTRRPVDPAALSDRQTAVLKQLSAEIVYVSPATVPGAAIDVDLDYEEWFDEREAQVVITRPDFYIFAVLTDVTELGAVIDDLADQLALA